MNLIDKFNKENFYNKKKYNIVNVKTKELLEKVINNVAFIFDGVIDFNKISLLYSAGWWNKEKIKFYVLKSNLVEKIYELTPTGEEIVCVLIEDLDEKVIIKNKLRKVGQQFITNIDGTKISSLKDKIDIQKKTLNQRAHFIVLCMEK